MHMYVRGWYVNKISSLSVGLIPIQWCIICVSAGGKDNITHLCFYPMITTGQYSRFANLNIPISSDWQINLI